MAQTMAAKWQALYDKAQAAGHEAAKAAKPVPMIVGSPVNMGASLMGMDDGGLDPTKPVYYVAGGVCGFAWVKVPGNSGFGRWALRTGRGYKAYGGGVAISARNIGGQSMQIKEAWAGAFAKVLHEAGVEKVYVESRMD